MNKKELQFGIQLNKIPIKRLIEQDGKMLHGTIDLGVNSNKSEETTYALVFLLVCLNGHFILKYTLN